MRHISQPKYLQINVAILLLGITGIILTGLWLTNGHIGFALDDPYIHLALADNIWQGHYGIFPSEVSSPSSSILWPFMIAPVAGSKSLAEFYITFLNIAFTISALWQFHQVVARYLSEKTWINVLTGIMFMVVGNVWFLVATGMEHCLQLFLTMVALRAVIDELEDGTLRMSGLIALGLLPLVRYECAVFSGIFLFHLAFIRGYLRASITTGVLLAVVGLGFSVFLLMIGQGILPASITAKSSFTVTGSIVGGLLKNVTGKIGAYWMIAILISVSCIGDLLWKKRIAGSKALLAKILIVLTVIHYFTTTAAPRYDAYVIVSVLTGGIYIAAEQIRSYIQARKRVYLVGQVAVGLLVLFWPLSWFSVMAGVGISNIYWQQGQMARFARDFYKGPVAVNDLGVVAYQNDYHVLDLWGLASLKAQKLRVAGGGQSGWAEKITEEEQVGLAMIYDEWFPELPASWTKVAELKYDEDKLKVYVAQADVSFYATTAGDIPKIQRDLEAFSKTLSGPTKIVFTGPRVAQYGD